MPLLQCFRQWPKVSEQESHAYNCMLKAGDSQSVGFLTWPLPTVPWDSYYHSSVEEADEIPDYPHASNEFLQDLFCSKAGRAHICEVPAFV